MSSNGFFDSRGSPIKRGVYQLGRKESFYLFVGLEQKQVGLNPNSKVWVVRNISTGGEEYVIRSESVKYRPADSRKLRRAVQKARDKSEKLTEQAELVREKYDRMVDFLFDSLS
jgi:hypothetical protein